MKKLKVLIGCEQSGTVREAFKALGHDAWSCDILPTDIPGKHFQCDIFEVLDQKWDLMIAHPSCVYLTVTGNKWFYHPEDSALPTSERRPHPKFPNRWQDRAEAIDFFMRLMNADIPQIALENPIGVMSSVYRKPDQVIQPWQYGHETTKSTCLWLKNLPLLKPTNIVSKGEIVTYQSGKTMSKWYSDTAKLKPAERSKARSKTFQGIADALAMQYGGLVND